MSLTGARPRRPDRSSSFCGRFGALAMAVCVSVCSVACTAAIRAEVGPFATSDGRVGAMLGVALAGGKRALPSEREVDDQVVMTRPATPLGPLVWVGVGAGAAVDLDDDGDAQTVGAGALEAELEVRRLRGERQWTLGLGWTADLRDLPYGASSPGGHGPSISVGRYRIRGTGDSWFARGLRADCSFAVAGLPAEETGWMRCDLLVSLQWSRHLGPVDAAIGQVSR